MHNPSVTASPCHLRAPFVRFADIFPADGEINPHQREALGGGEHVFDEDAVADCGVVDEDVGDGADELAVLDDGTAGHECVKCRTKLFSIFSDIFLKYVEKTSMRVEEPINTT